ncbi:MAG: ribosome maturation factor RimP [Gammaproteobacteria bacterium]|nr:ribosome maturation factor RimP [Gammaproteobacteria bacterium]
MNAPKMAPGIGPLRQDPFNLTNMLAPVARDLGFELIGVEYQPGIRARVRLYIDSPTGITVEDCADMSHAVSAVLDVEDPIPGKYTLEVSSPGLDRPLFRLEDFARYAGQRARIRLQRPLPGSVPAVPGGRPQRNFLGVLAGVEGGEVLLDTETGLLRLPYADIDKAHLEPEF